MISAVFETWQDQRRCGCGRAERSRWQDPHVRTPARRTWCAAVVESVHRWGGRWAQPATWSAGADLSGLAVLLFPLALMQMWILLYYWANKMMAIMCRKEPREKQKSSRKANESRHSIINLPYKLCTRAWRRNLCAFFSECIFVFNLSLRKSNET